MVPVVKNLPDNAVDISDTDSIPKLGRYPGGRHGNPFHYLAWSIPWTEDLGRIQSTGLHRVRRD